MGMVVKAATLPLRRRMIGSLILLAGILIVALGFFVDLRRGNAPDVRSLSPSRLAQLPAPLGTGTTGATVLQHVFDHGLRSGGNVVRLSDMALRGGVVAMALAAAAALLALAVPGLRGLAGVAAGVGLLGDAMVAGDLVGANAQLSLSSAGAALSVQLGAGIWICAAGFVVILVGGALAAFRPLAGVAAGISLAVLGAGLGAGTALLVGGDRLAAAAGIPRPF